MVITLFGVRHDEIRLPAPAVGIGRPDFVLDGVTARLVHFDIYGITRGAKAREGPCVLDVFISITRFMNGEEPRPWWDYTAQRKQLLNQEAST